MTTHTPAPAQQAVLTDDEINDICERPASNTTMRAENDRALARATEQALLSKLGAPVADERAAAINPEECNAEVYKHGTSVGLFAIPKDDANAICAGIAAATGARVDWHYIAGRVHIKALPALANAPVADERAAISGVTLDGCLETLFCVGEHLGINYAESRKQPGAPSGVYIKAIEDRVSRASNAAREEAAKLMEQTSRSSGAALIRTLESAPVAGEAQQESAALRQARHDTANAQTDRERIEALAYWLDQQKSEPEMLSCAAATLRAMLTRDAAPQASAEPAQPCSCPSGDGSLRHPCAVHPTSATQPEQGERDAC